MHDRVPVSPDAAVKSGTTISPLPARPPTNRSLSVSVRTAALGLFLGAVAARAQDCTNAAATPSVCAFDAAKNAAAKTKIKGVLLYDWTVGGHQKTHTQNHMLRLAQKYGFRLDRSDAQTYITPQTLNGIDLIIFNNGDNDPLQNSTALAAVRNFVEVQGKGILVIHAGAAYIPCPNENLADSGCRWIMRGLRTQYWVSNYDNTRATLYADSVIAGQVPPRATGTSAVPSAHNHGLKNPETVNIYKGLPTNAGSGPLANRPNVWEGLGDEWYNYRNNPRLEGARTLDGVEYGPINILLSLDESSIDDNALCNFGSNCKNIGTYGDRPAAWTRKIGNGNLVYQNAAHTNVYTRVRVAGGASVNDSIIEKINWRLMKYLARDFVGCMDSTSTYYNPEASVTQLNPGIDNPEPCQATALNPVRARPARVELGRDNRSLTVSLPDRALYQILASDARGKTIYSRNSQGPGILSSPPLRTGLYIVQVISTGGRHVSRVEIRPR